ncbi:hypothetical protein B0T16DRAFT_495502 [Cercophora newfieldiana]|uniref:Uncharacterized protein n=1 Tax=Cercophora newfieldiana TaxID=92897 RepID=A0AA39XUS0_9PEZI|nr:hypothetical protein B0T16DRAFT_495502 [Cercophora newfieldiana]
MKNALQRVCGRLRLRIKTTEKNRKRKKQFPFLQLPGELRNQIYRCLYTRPCLEKDEAKDFVIPHGWSQGVPMPKFRRLKPLMRSCRQIHSEIMSFLYDHKYKLDGTKDWHVKFLLEGPGRYLRDVHIEFPAVDASTLTAYRCLDLRVLEALAKIASPGRLEHLYLDFGPARIYHIPGKIPDPYTVQYSWVDLPQNLTTNWWTNAKMEFDFSKGVQVEQDPNDETAKWGVWEKLFPAVRHQAAFHQRGDELLELLRGLQLNPRQIKIAGWVDGKGTILTASTTGVTVKVWP